MLVVAALLLLAATYFGAVGALGLAGRLRPNRFAGVRTPVTLRNEAAFALANRVAGPTTLAAAFLFAAGGAATLALDGWGRVAAVAAAVVAAFLTAGAGASLGLRAAAALPEPVRHGCGSCSLNGACSPAADLCGTAAPEGSPAAREA